MGRLGKRLIGEPDKAKACAGLSGDSRRTLLLDHGLFCRFDESRSLLHPNEISCTLMFESIQAPLRLSASAWMTLPRHLYLKQSSGILTRAHRISASAELEQGMLAHNLIFETESQIPESVGCDHPEFRVEHCLTSELRDFIHETLQNEQGQNSALWS